MMTVPQAHRAEPDETAHELMEAVTDDEGATMVFYYGDAEWPCVVETTLITEMTICWW